MKYIVEGSGADIWFCGDVGLVGIYQIPGVSDPRSGNTSFKDSSTQNWNNFTSPPGKKKLQKITKITKKKLQKVLKFSGTFSTIPLFLFTSGDLFTSED